MTALNHTFRRRSEAVWMPSSQLKGFVERLRLACSIRVSKRAFVRIVRKVNSVKFFVFNNRQWFESHPLRQPVNPFPSTCVGKHRLIADLAKNLTEIAASMCVGRCGSHETVGSAELLNQRDVAQVASRVDQMLATHWGTALYMLIVAAFLLTKRTT